MSSILALEKGSKTNKKKTFQSSYSIVFLLIRPFLFSTEKVSMFCKLFVTFTLFFSSKQNSVDCGMAKESNQKGGQITTMNVGQLIV